MQLRTARATRPYWFATLVILLLAAFSVPAATAKSSPRHAKAAAAAQHAIAQPRQGPPKPPEPEDEPEEANAYFLSKRLAPGMTEYPMPQLLKAQQDAQQLPLYSTPLGAMIAGPGGKASQALTWSSVGPGNIGGRTRAFKFVPGSSTTIYAAGVAGGVWKSTNAGTSWTALGDAMANMAVTALLIDPSNTNVLYAGTGEGYFNIDRVRGAGIFKSVDGGVNWSQLASTNNSNFNFINDLAFKPGSPAIIYAATGIGLYRSLDSGASWTQMIDATNSNGCMTVVYRNDVDTVVASCGTRAPTATSNGIWRSTNASVASPTWTHIVGPSGSGETQTLANMGRTSIAIAPSNQAIMYALISCCQSGANTCGTGNIYNDGLLAVYQSIDGGATWSPKYTNTLSTSSVVNADLLLTNPVIARLVTCGYNPPNSFLNQGWYDNVIAVDPLNPASVWVGGIDLWRSDDSGASWGIASYWWKSGDPKYVHADQHGIVFDPGFDGTVTNSIMYVFDDGGMWKTANARDAVGTNGANDTSNSLCFDTTPNKPAVSWTNLNNGYGVTQFYHGTVYPTGTQYFGGTQDNGTPRGTDGAPNAWTSIHGGDGGWTAIDKTTSGASTVLYAEFTRISIQKSPSNGAPDTFVDAISGILGASCGLFINPFQMDPNNPQRLFTSNNVLWRTSDAAATWSSASATIPGASCGGTDSGERFSNYAIAPGNSDLLVAGTNGGRICRLVNATTSTAATAIQDCTAPAGAGTYVSEIAFAPNNPLVVYAAISTFGVGHIWKSTNAGATWTNISGVGMNALPDSPAHSVAASPADPNTVYAGTEIGVFVTTDGGANWARENTGFANVITDHLVFSPTGGTGQTLYAFTHGRGVFRASAANSAASTTTLGTSGASVFGQSVTLTATVTGGSGTPTGTITFLDGATVLQAGAALNGSGVATFGTSALTVGTHNLFAVYSGSGTYQASIGKTTQTVSKAGTTVSITNDTPEPSVVGQSVAVTAGVSVSAPGAGVPGGTISVTGSNTTGCTITLPATSCNLVFTIAGAQTINAAYNGDAGFNTSSTGMATAHTVNKASTTLSITESPDPSAQFASVTVTKTLNVSAPGAGTPGGTITVTGSGTTGCTITLPATTCVLTFTALGAQTIDATYNGTANFNGSAATQIGHTVVDQIFKNGFETPAP